MNFRISIPTRYLSLRDINNLCVITGGEFIVKREKILLLEVKGKTSYDGE